MTTEEMRELLVHLRNQLCCVTCIDPVNYECPTHGSLPTDVIDAVLATMTETADA